MNRREELDKPMADTRERFGAIVAASLEEIASVREDASATVARYEEARRSLASVEGQIASLEAERDALPERAYEANLNDDPTREAELRSRFRQIPAEMDRLEAHRDRLRGELASLRSDPEHPDPELDALRVRSRQASRTSGAAYAAWGDLEGFRKELAESLEKAVEPVDRERRATLGRIESLNATIDSRVRGRRVLG